MSRRMSVLLSSILLSGCANLHVMSHVPLSTLSRLSSLSIAEIAPADLRVAARLPANLEPRQGGVKVRLALPATSRAKGMSEEFVLEPALAPSELSPLSAHSRSGSRLWVYRLARADVDRLNKMLYAGNSPAERAGISIAASADACHRKPLGSAALPTTMFLRTNASGYFVLTEDLDFRSVVSDRDLATKVPPCA